MRGEGVEFRGAFIDFCCLGRLLLLDRISKVARPQRSVSGEWISSWLNSIDVDIEIVLQEVIGQI